MAFPVDFAALFDGASLRCRGVTSRLVRCNWTRGALTADGHPHPIAEPLRMNFGYCSLRIQQRHEGINWPIGSFFRPLPAPAPEPASATPPVPAQALPAVDRPVTSPPGGHPDGADADVGQAHGAERQLPAQHGPDTPVAKRARVDAGAAREAAAVDAAPAAPVGWRGWRGFACESCTRVFDLPETSGGNRLTCPGCLVPQVLLEQAPEP